MGDPTGTAVISSERRGLWHRLYAAIFIFIGDEGLDVVLAFASFDLISLRAMRVIVEDRVGNEVFVLDDRVQECPYPWFSPHSSVFAEFFRSGYRGTRQK